MKGPKITKDVVEDVKQTYSKYPTMTHEDVAKMCGTSRTSVGKILAGSYDWLLEGECQPMSYIGADRDILERIAVALEKIAGGGQMPLFDE